MPNNPSVKKIAAVVATCALAGAGAGIAGSAASPKSKHSDSGASGASGATGATGHHGRFGRHGGFGPGGPGFGHGLGFGFGPVHAELVIPNRAGTGFDTVTSDSGKVKSVDANKITVTEGTDKATYKTVEIDVGDSAKVERNHADAKVSDLQEGDYVGVLHGPTGYFVHAESAAFRKSEQSRGPRFGPPGAPDGAPRGGGFRGGYGPGPGSAY